MALSKRALREKLPEDYDIYWQWRTDWNKFAREVLRVKLDPEQQEVLEAVQNNKMVAVASGTARGKDYVAAVAALCFLYLTPRWDLKGNMIQNTKVAMTAPTGRQVSNIMYPEIVRLYNNSLFQLHGRLVGNDIRTENAEWFLTGFKADDHNHEAWSGFHAVNTMFVITEASGIAEGTFAAIEGNLQAQSKILIVFNPNNSIGYAAKAMSSSRWISYRLDDLTAPNVLEKRMIFPGQVDYDWVKDKVESWCIRIEERDFDEGQGDFEFEGSLYRPNDLFRVKVRGMFPQVSSDVLIPYLWVELANERWENKRNAHLEGFRKIGVDVAGMGRDSTVICHRFNDFVKEFDVYQSGGNADHMKIAGVLKHFAEGRTNIYIDTIGEGAGVYSRLIEQNCERWVYSCKFSENAQGLSDITGEFEFANMRAYLFWCIRDWLNPAFNNEACLPPIQQLTEELIETKYMFQSNGKLIIEPKEDIKERLGRSPDYMDALANTFYPMERTGSMSIHELSRILP